jgi:phosphopantetheinyl transferase
MTLQLPPTMKVAFHQYGSDAQFQADMKLLHPIEREYIMMFRNTERQRASAAARVACQMALERSYCRDIAVIPDDHGTPTALHTMTGAPLNYISVSLTHRNGVAGALVCTDGSGPALGLDLEKPGPSILKTMDDFFVPSERHEILQHDEAKSILVATQVWAAREATLKAAGLGFSVPANTVEVQNVSCDGGKAILRGVESEDSVLEVGLRFGEVEEMVTCVAWIPGRTTQEMRSHRPKPRRSFVWTGIKDKFQNSRIARRNP